MQLFDPLRVLSLLILSYCIWIKLYYTVRKEKRISVHEPLVIQRGFNMLIKTLQSKKYCFDGLEYKLFIKNEFSLPSLTRFILNNEVK